MPSLGAGIHRSGPVRELFRAASDMRHRKASVAALGALLLLVACGDRSEATGTPSPKSAAPAIPATRPPGSPEAAFDRRKHDFGVAAQGVDLRTEFRLENKGASPLHVQGVHGNCGCILADAKTKTLAAGASTTVDVVFQTHAMVGP